MVCVECTFVLCVFNVFNVFSDVFRFSRILPFSRKSHVDFGNEGVCQPRL